MLRAEGLEGLAIDLENPPVPDDVRREYEQLFLTSYPGLTQESLAPSTPTGKIIETLTTRDLQHVHNILVLLNMFRGSVRGAELDAFVQNHYALKRKPRVHGTAAITIYGTPGHIIEGGFQVRGYNTPPFTLLRTVQLPSTGKLTIDFVESKFSTVTYPPQTLTQIIITSYDVHRVAQEKPSVPGREQETDLEYFTRAISWGSKSNNSSYYSIMAEVAAVPGVVKCNGWENASVTSNTHQGTEFPAHSVGIVAYGGTDQDIANAISATKPPGVVLAGDVEVPVQVGTKQIPYKFFRPQGVPLQVSVTVKLSPGAPNNYEDIIRETLIAHVDGLLINSTVQYTGIVCALEKIKFNFNYEKVVFAKKGETLGTTNVELQFIEMATLVATDIAVMKSS